MNSLIVKMGATGDVVRTTPLLRRLAGRCTWVTMEKNKSLLENLPGKNGDLRVLAWKERSVLSGERFDLVIGLEDDIESGRLIASVKAKKIFGGHLNSGNEMTYSDDARGWFDLSLISVHGRAAADRLKLLNRHTYQELVFAGLGMRFQSEEYLLPLTPESGMHGDVAIAPEAGPVWPMKKWAYFDGLKQELENHGLTVNYLPTRSTLLEHLADIRGHRCVVCGDSLPMHLAIGSGIRCVALFNCTSPWEIHDYGILTKVISPLLEQFFYRREFDPRAITAISLEEVYLATMDQLAKSQSSHPRHLASHCLLSVLP
jgi:heptosyltransferase-2